MELVGGDDSGEDEAEPESPSEPKVAPQHFFPSFAPLFAGTNPLAHSRPQFQESRQFHDNFR